MAVVSGGRTGGLEGGEAARGCGGSGAEGAF